jgi:cyanophycinase
MPRRLLALALLALAALPLAAQPARGTLFLVGGGPQPDTLVREFVGLAGGPGKARIVVFGMAADDGPGDGEEKAADLRTRGAEARSFWLTRAEADADSMVRILDSATGIWFTGGDQVRLAGILRGSRTLAAIARRWRAGAVVGGTSAGAAVMSAVMLTGDERHPGGARPPDDTTNHWLTIARDNVVTEDGFGFVANAIVDQHFLRRKRHNRLLSLVLERAPHLGVGIDESTALVVEPGGRWRVAGASVVTIYDARRARAAGGAVLGASGVTLHVLPAGSTFDPATGAARVPRR